MNVVGIFMLALLLAAVIIVINGIHRRFTKKPTLTRDEAEELAALRRYIRLKGLHSKDDAADAGQDPNASFRGHR